MGENKVIRRIIPAVLTLLILGIFLSLYFFKYLPRRQDDYNRRAFLELEQIEKAIQSRNGAYTRALTYIQDATFAQRNPKVSSPLFRSFKDATIRRSDPAYHRLAQNEAMFIAEDPSNGYYRLTYPLLNPGTAATATPAKTAFPQATGPPSTSPPDTTAIRIMSIRLDSVLNPIISTYKDIFANYLLIGPPNPENIHESRIIFNPDNLSLDFRINIDSLLSKHDGFSIRNVRDVTIQGSSYKLFIYPFRLGNQAVILAGLTTASNYSDGYTDIPLNLLVPVSIVIIMLLINFPILKVFILGIYERITDMDIRLIIGSYFIAAIAGFFLFSWLFLMRIQTVDNQKNLESLSGSVQSGFLKELNLITGQLKVWDTTYAGLLHRKDTTLLNGMKGNRLGKDDSIALDKLYQPVYYPWSDYTFWIDAEGKWQAIWSEKKYNNRPILLQVADRKYFKDFVNRKYLLLPGDSAPCPFTIQPTLSKLDGEYTISVVIPSKASPSILVGLSSQMVSVTNTIMPCGYNFSIIDDNGLVLYDSRPGHALLSNILKESDDPASILECTRYHSSRYFSSFRLKGQKVALVAAPMKTLPYTIITWYSLADADSSQIHLIGLAAFFSTCVLLLLILSTIINEWTGKKPGILLAPSKHFEWLRPLPHKEKYYRRLITGMLSTLAIYILAWCIIRSLPRELEFSLFFISLALPFYVALYYYALREKQKQPGKKFRELMVTRPLIPVLLFLALILVVLLSFSTADTSSAGWIPWISLVTQGLLLSVLAWLTSSFGTKPKSSDVTTGSPSPTPAYSGPLRSCPPPCEVHGKAWLKYYAAAIVTGVVLISIIPACGIFWLLSWQEHSLQNNSSRVATARAINIRRLHLNDRIADYKSALGDIDPKNNLDSARHHQLKFSHGLYLLPGDTILPAPAQSLRPFFPLSTQYQDIHHLIFPEDSNILSAAADPNSADDKTWSFFTADSPRHHVWLQYEAPTDRVDNGPLQIQAGRAASGSSLSLISHQTGSTGALFIFLYFGSQLLSVFLAYKVTMALATRIFMIDLFEDLPCPVEGLNAELETIRNNEKDNCSQETILCNRQLHEKLYAQLWKPLPPMEKFVLYDLAKDGFTNYRTGSILWRLQKRNLLVFSNGQLEPVSDSFREYVLSQYDDPGVITCLKKSRQEGSWRSFKLPLTILFTAFGLFIFFTQGALYQKLGGLLTSLLSMGSQISSFFDKAGRQPAPEIDTPPGEEAGN